MQQMAQQAMKDNEESMEYERREMERTFKREADDAKAELKAALKSSKSDNLKQVRRCCGCRCDVCGS